MHVEMVKGVGFCTRWIFCFRDLIEEPRRLVHSEVTNVQIGFFCCQWSPSTKGDGIGDPTLGPNRVQGQNFVEGNAEHFVVKESSGGLVEGFVGTEVMEAKGKLVPSFVDPKALHSEYIHVVGVDQRWVNCPVGWILTREE